MGCWYRGVHLANWVLQNGFHILSGQTNAHDINDSWTCQRYFDETRVQLDFILGDSKANVADVWHDNIVPIGLDHRCVHCSVTWTAKRKLKKMSAKGLKHWKPYLDENGEPTQYQSKLRHIEANNYGNVNEQLLKLEGGILMAGREGGECKRLQTRFLPSDDLKQLRLQRREAENRGIKKELFFSDSQTSTTRTPEMEIIKSSDAFTSAQPMEATTKTTTWHWPSSCRSASAKRLRKHACQSFQRASEQSISTTSTYGSGLELTGSKARNQADESKQSLG